MHVIWFISTLSFSRDLTHRSHSCSVIRFGFRTKMQAVELNNGRKMPLIGFGTAFGPSNDDPAIETYIEDALEGGYRHFDTAYLYKTEKPLGAVLGSWFAAGKLKRDDVFVTTKLPSIGMRPGKVRHFLQLSLKNLQLTHVDLYLIHWPIGLVYRSDDELVPKDETGQIMYDHATDLESVWKAMEALVGLGLARSIGVSNFSVTQIHRICKIARILPAALQIETSVYIQQRELREACSRYSIHVTAFAPLGSPARVLARNASKELTATAEPVDVNGNNSCSAVSKPQPQPDLLLNNETVTTVAQKHGKTPAQVALRFLTQQNISVIPKSRSPERMRENIKSLDFELDEPDLHSLRSLDRGKFARAFDYFPGGMNHPEYPFD